MSKNEDILLIAKCLLNDDRRAYTRLVDKYHPQIKRFFLNQTLGDAMLSDDLAQETFIKAYTSLRSFKGLSSFSTWIFRIAYNVFYDFMRSRKCSEEYSSDVLDQDYELPSETLTRNIDIGMRLIFIINSVRIFERHAPIGAGVLRERNTHPTAERGRNIGHIQSRGGKLFSRNGIIKP